MTISPERFTETMRRFAATGATVPELVDEFCRTGDLLGINAHEDREAVIVARKRSNAEANPTTPGELERRDGWTVWRLP